MPEMLEEEAGAVQAVAEQSAGEVGDGEEGKARREKMPMLVKSLRMTESSVRTGASKPPPRTLSFTERLEDTDDRME